MTILIADEQKERREAVESMLKKLRPDVEIKTFDSGLSALAEARKTEISTAFLRAELPELSGIDLGRYLKDLYPFVNLIFLSGSRDYSYEAMKLHASGYLLEPAEETGVKRELEELRYPEDQQKKKRVFAQTFGNFDLFVDGKPVNFKYTKTKEIVALLINNRGAQTTNGEIIASLWEDDGDPEKKTSYLSNLRQDLQNTFHKLKLDGIIQKQRGSMAIAKDKIECDLFDWLEKKKDSKYQYLGDYMNQYSWSEYLHAELDEISYAMEDDDY